VFPLSLIFEIKIGCSLASFAFESVRVCVCVCVCVCVWVSTSVMKYEIATIISLCAEKGQPGHVPAWTL